MTVNTVMYDERWTDHGWRLTGPMMVGMLHELVPKPMPNVTAASTPRKSAISVSSSLWTDCEPATHTDSTWCSYFPPRWQRQHGMGRGYWGYSNHAHKFMFIMHRHNMYIVTTIAIWTSAQRMLCYTPRFPSNNQHIEATSFHVGHATIGCLRALHITPTSRRVSMVVLDCYVRSSLTQYLNVTQSYKRWGAVNTRIMCYLCWYLVHLMANKSHVSRNSRPLRDITPNRGNIVCGISSAQLSNDVIINLTIPETMWMVAVCSRKFLLNIFCSQLVAHMYINLVWCHCGKRVRSKVTTCLCQCQNMNRQIIHLQKGYNMHQEAYRTRHRKLEIALKNQWKNLRMDKADHKI